MKSLGVLICALALEVLALLIVPAVVVLADSGRTPAEATAHALDELANCYAQRRPECPTSTPTLTPTPTWTPSPTSTSTPQPTDTPTPASTATPEPCWLTDQDQGDPDNGWIVFDKDGAPVPCPADQVDQVNEQSEATLEPTSTPSPASTPQPAAAPAPAQVVVQTMVVLVTATPAATSLPTPTVAFTSTPTQTATSSPPATKTPIVTATPTATPTSLAIATEDHSAVPTVAVDWWLLGKVIGSSVVLLVVVAIGVAIKRRTVVRKPRPPRGGAYA